MLMIWLMFDALPFVEGGVLVVESEALWLCKDKDGDFDVMIGKN